MNGKTKRLIRVWLMRVRRAIAPFLGGFVLWKIWIWFYSPDDIAEVLRMFSVGFCYWAAVILVLSACWLCRKKLSRFLGMITDMKRYYTSSRRTLPRT